MDKNSIIGLILIALLIGSYTYFNQPDPEELKAARIRQDSIEAITMAQQQMAAAAAAATPPATSIDTDTTTLPNDTAIQDIVKQQWGDFAGAVNGNETLSVLENDVLKVTFSSQGGKIKSAELKKYKTDKGAPVSLLSGDSSIFALSFSVQNRTIRTEKLFFEPAAISKLPDGSQLLTLALNAGNGRSIIYQYSLAKDSYLLGFKVKLHGLEQLIPSNQNIIQVDWRQRLSSLEKSIENERAASTIYYRFSDDEVDYISYTSDEQQSLKTKVKWVAFKQQFFTSVLIADNFIESPVVETYHDPADLTYIKTMSASFTLPFEHKADETYGMRFYLGPNHYQTLKKIDDLNLEEQIQLGWGIFGWVNRFMVIPIFNFLNSFNLNFGLIILILTVLIRIVLLPLTYGSFKSQAKMKVLQPEIAEITEKIPDDPLKRQQETMSLYRKAGVNPLGGCIPGLLQMPILIAMFSFFPSSIELRQESFLWAHDLSTYDSILDLPFKIPFYGSHVSLFTLLMTISTLLYTKMNMQMTSVANPQMKWMMYLMPVMFLGIFNNYSAGLSYYYFLSNCFGFGQQYLFKAFVDEDAIHRKIQENKKRPQAQKKSGFQQRLEQMAKERGYKPKK
jgi:YidC/Oxa1 family membrane protein insertase